MRKFLKFAGVLAIALVAGCSHHSACTDSCEIHRPRPVEPVACAAPARVHCGQVASCSANCCASQVRTVREPVEVVYRRTVYRTVFEPRTYRTVNYEREAFVGSRGASVERVAFVEPRQQERAAFRTVANNEVNFSGCDTHGCYK